jgi:hypothetical protein
VELSAANARGDKSGERSARIPASQVDGGDDVKIVPGGAVDLINLSDSGALIEGKTRCAVNSAVTLCIGGKNPRRIQARVVRCNVSAIHRDSSMSYQLALTFGDAPASDAAVDRGTTDAPVAPPPAPVAPAVLAAATPMVEELVNEW